MCQTLSKALEMSRLTSRASLRECLDPTLGLIQESVEGGVAWSEAKLTNVELRVEGRPEPVTYTNILLTRSKSEIGR